MSESGTEVRHPIFARMYARFAAEAEAKGAAEHRRELLTGLSGRVIEVGAGTGLNFRHYPDAVREVVATEPEPLLRRIAGEEADRASVPVRVVDGVADPLPAEDASFDAGVASLVLCSVPDQARALAELRRVIRPGGELRFYEHVRASSPAFARLQRAVDVVWPLCSGGCHTSRDTLSAIQGAGFGVERLRRFRFVPFVLARPVAPHIVGVARRP
jgi:ubiquinone/menaquinone biosynthesis C-methylase UbiE